MARQETRTDRPTDYERAVCYYTLPKVINPITYGIIVAYAVCLFEAVTALVIGVVLDNRTWTVAGTVALVGMIVFGIAVFTARALINDVRERKALAAARTVPEPIEPVADIPDPFAGHLLFKYPRDGQGNVYLCERGEMVLRYHVEHAKGQKWWRVTTPEKKDVFRIRSFGGVRSFLFEALQPGRLGVYVGDELAAQIDRRFSFTSSVFEITTLLPESGRYVVREQGIYYDRCLVGRIYELRGAAYLDMDKHLYGEAMLAHFITSV